MTTERLLSGSGRTVVRAPREAVWAALLDPAVLVRLIPAARTVERLDEVTYCATLGLGVGPLHSEYRVQLQLANVDGPRSVELAGESKGGLGGGDARGYVTLTERGGGTVLAWRFEGAVHGAISRVGGPVLRFATRLFVARFFAELGRLAAG